jgi:hypothetical protein
MKFEVNMVLERETKGAYRYAEVDDAGNPVEAVWSKLGTQYIRKTAFAQGTPAPRKLRVTVEVTA